MGRLSSRIAVVLSLFLALASVVVDATNLTDQEVRAGVETWVRQVTADARPDAVVEAMLGYGPGGQPSAYVVRFVGGGYCLCGADDRLLPVYLYSPYGRYDPEDRNNQFILESIASRLEALGHDASDPRLAAYQQELSSRAAVWRALISGHVPTQRELQPMGAGFDPVEVRLPLTSQWHQDSPYNDNCPNVTPGQDERTLVGCVATAMSQIMYYWKWPSAGTGTVPTPFPYKYRFSTTWLTEPLAAAPSIPASWNTRLRWDSAGGGTLSMTGYWDEESVYHEAQRLSTDSSYGAALSALWNRMTPAQMLPDVNLSAPINWGTIQDTHADPPDDGDTAVAALCHAVGVTVYMHYGLWFTTGFDYHIADSLRDHFFYDPAVVHEAPDVEKMVEELQWFRVLELGGNGPPGGHSWVAHGYNQATSPTQFLMNLGWGNPSAWYSLDQIFPNDQTMTTGIAPLNAVKFVGATGSGDGSPTAPYRDIEQALANAPDGATLVLKAGSEITFASPTLRLARRCTLKSAFATIRHQ